MNTREPVRFLQLCLPALLVPFLVYLGVRGQIKLSGLVLLALFTLLLEFNTLIVYRVASLFLARRS